MVVLIADLMDSMYSCRYKNLRDSSVNVGRQEIQQLQVQSEELNSARMLCEPAVSSGGSKGGEGRALPFSPIFVFIFTQFRLKLCQIISWCSPLCIWHPPDLIHPTNPPPPPGNPGFATGVCCLYNTSRLKY